LAVDNVQLHFGQRHQGLGGRGRLVGLLQQRVERFLRSCVSDVT
jgi:hypothetical protein